MGRGARIIQLINQGVTSSTEMALALGWSGRTTRWVLHRLVDQGAVRRLKPGLYEVVPTDYPEVPPIPAASPKDLFWVQVISVAVIIELVLQVSIRI